MNPDGTLKFTFNFESATYSSPSIGADGTIYLCNNTDKLFAFGPGDEKSELFIPENIAASDGTDADKVQITWVTPASGAVPDGTMFIARFLVTPQSILVAENKHF